jgi:selenocysteine-specific elongation factor
MKDVIIGTAGHIDHGKTSLVRALTGIDTDRLAEEKRRGITIDIGFAHLTLGEYRVGFIDVPGHERFVKNMLAGVGGVQFLLMVVAADESIMPQTLEHFQICQLMGISRGVVVITKRELVDDELLLLVQEEVSDLVQGSFLEGAPIVAVDCVSGEGIDDLKAIIHRSINAAFDVQSVSPGPSPEVFRLPIDRVFSIKGFGTVVTGSPLGGELKKDEPVTVYPSRKAGKVRGIEVFNQKASTVRAGQRTALNLSGLERSELARGMVLSVSRDLTASQMFDTSVRLLEGAPGPLKHRSPVRFHSGTSELIGRLYLMGKRTLRPGESAYAQFRLDAPTIGFPGDRFVLRRYSPLTTIGGGIILDNSPSKHRARDIEGLIPYLKTLSTALGATTGERSRTLISYCVEKAGIKGIDVKGLMAQTGLQETHIREVIADSDDLLVVPQDPPLAVLKQSIEGLEKDVVRFLEGFHKQNPLFFGVSREELRERFFSGAGSAYSQFILDYLSRQQVLEVRASQVALYGSTRKLDPRQQEIREGIIECLRKTPFRPPSLKEIVDRLPQTAEEVRRVYYYLVEKGDILKVSEEVVLLPEQYQVIRERTAAAFPGGTRFSVPEFKDLFGISRKYAIPLLEFLDREKVTRRTGDQRTLLD